MNTEDYVSYPIALALKKAGFDEPCIAQWACEPDGKPMLVGSTAFVFNNAELKGRDVSAPFMWQAQKWLRDIKRLSIEPYANIAVAWNYNIADLDNFAENVGGEASFPSYESALSAGIAAALELIGEKGE